jgi:hypothetical protein
MWLRRTYHECAAELRQISERFRLALTGEGPWDAAENEEILHETSMRGIEVLRILALSIRSDQDYGLTPNEPAPVGALREDILVTEAEALGQTYRPPHDRLPGFSPLRLRSALNKIAHANPVGNGFYATRKTHDLLITGSLKRQTWMAVISVIEICDVIDSLPDSQIKKR